MRPIETGICANCGATNGLHHFETEQCPKGGVHEYREGRPQQWETTTFEDSGYKKLYVAAPDLLEALERFVAFADRVKADQDKEKGYISTFESSMVLKAKEAIKKATI